MEWRRVTPEVGAEITGKPGWHTKEIDRQEAWLTTAPSNLTAKCVRYTKPLSSLGRKLGDHCATTPLRMPCTFLFDSV